MNCRAGTDDSFRPAILSFAFKRSPFIKSLLVTGMFDKQDFFRNESKLCPLLFVVTSCGEVWMSSCDLLNLGFEF